LSYVDPLDPLARNGCVRHDHARRGGPQRAAQHLQELSMNMPRLQSIICALAVGTTATLAACGAGDAPAAAAAAAAPAAPKAVPAPAAPVVHADRGRVTAIEPITATAKPSGAGAVVGGVLGAVVGNQVGKGNGRTAATAVGAVGGAVVGNHVEKSRSESVVGYRVTVQMDNGSTRSLEQSQLNDLRVGDRVRLDGGALRRV
jgi:outer membrane lipoprotein SlyB